jgi:hypothetical protein
MDSIYRRRLIAEERTMRYAKYMISGLLMVIGLTLGYPAQSNNQGQETAWSDLTSLYQPIRDHSVDNQELQNSPIHCWINVKNTEPIPPKPPSR